MTDEQFDEVIALIGERMLAMANQLSLMNDTLKDISIRLAHMDESISQIDIP